MWFVSKKSRKRIGPGIAAGASLSFISGASSNGLPLRKSATGNALPAEIPKKVFLEMFASAGRKTSLRTRKNVWSHTLVAACVKNSESVVILVLLPVILVLVTHVMCLEMTKNAFVEGVQEKRNAETGERVGGARGCVEDYWAVGDIDVLKHAMVVIAPRARR